MNKRIFVTFIVCLSLNLSAATNVKSVNFIQEGEVSKLIIDFDNKVVAEKNHIKDDKQIILDLQNVKAEKKYMRGIDTSEFSGSTVFISPYKKPGSKNDIRFAIQLRDNVRSYLESKGNRIILNIENRFGVFTRTKLKEAQNENLTASSVVEGEKVNVPKSNSVQDILQNLTQSGVKRYVGRKISLNVNDIPYPEVLKMIGDTSGFNIIIGSGVKSLPNLTLNLTNLPWDQVLDTIMSLGDLVAFKYGNILSIKTSTAAMADKQKEIDAESKNKALEPLVTKIFPVSYAKLGDLQTILTSYKSERGTIQSDTRTQQMIVKDTVEVIERMKKIVETLDTQTPQILIESKIVEAEESYSLRAGLSSGFQATYDPFTSGSTITEAGNSGTFDLNSAGMNGTTSSFISATMSVGRLTNLAFNLELMESESKGKIISSPKVITANNQAATLTSTTTRKFPVTNTNATTGVTSTEYEEVPVNINLNVTPKVTNEGAIGLQVSVSKSGFGVAETAGELPPVTNRAINTNVLVNNGSTVVIGGLYETSDTKTETGIPFLKDLPLIGWLFKSAYNPSKNRKELIVFITPRIINQEEAGLVNRELEDQLGI